MFNLYTVTTKYCLALAFSTSGKTVIVLFFWLMFHTSLLVYKDNEFRVLKGSGYFLPIKLFVCLLCELALY